MYIYTIDWFWQICNLLMDTPFVVNKKAVNDFFSQTHLNIDIIDALTCGNLLPFLWNHELVLEHPLASY